MRGSALHASIASIVNHTVRLPRARRPASYSAQLVTGCRCLGMWRRQAALALNGTAGVRVSGKGPPSYAAQLPMPIGPIRATRWFVAAQTTAPFDVSTRISDPNGGLAIGYSPWFEFVMWGRP